MNGGQIPLDLGHAPSHAEADFLVGEGNAMAHAHILAWPSWPGPLTLLLGPAHSGKSHLARIWAERAGAAMAGPDAIEEQSRAGGAQPLVIEDVDRAPYAEAALFHLLNQAMRDRRSLLMTARLPVSAWPFQTADLKSRARLAAMFEISASDDIELSHMLVKLLSDRQISVDPRIVSYLVVRMERSAEEAVRLVELMDRLSLARGSAITRSVAVDALEQRRRERSSEAPIAHGQSNDEESDDE